ncbi:MAG: VOC family protein [Propionibacteriaceae bacterium]|nr:VOC family protein [Propionibacteriaceae bacterium]
MPIISTTSVYVDDQDKALAFYTQKLGFVAKTDVTAGEYRWLTVVSDIFPDGVELVLEPDAHPAAKTFKQALVSDGIPFNSFVVTDVDGMYARLTAEGVIFTQAPVDMGPVRVAVLDDTCGNLIQLTTFKPEEDSDEPTEPEAVELQD